MVVFFYLDPDLTRKFLDDPRLFYHFQLNDFLFGPFRTYGKKRIFDGNAGRFYNRFFICEPFPTISMADTLLKGE